MIFAVLDGGAENAKTKNGRLENVALHAWKDWKTRDRFVGSRKRETGKRGNDEVWKAKRNLTT